LLADAQRRLHRLLVEWAHHHGSPGAGTTVFACSSILNMLKRLHGSGTSLVQTTMCMRL